MQVFTSFALLAAALVPAVAAPKKKKVKLDLDAVSMQVKAHCGANGLLVWAFINDAETTKRSGPKGEILFTPERLAIGTGLSLEALADVAFKLCRHGYARPCQNGSALKAA